MAQLITTGSERTQVVVISHSRALVNALDADDEIELVKELGETRIEGQGRLDEPPWHWPER